MNSGKDQELVMDGKTYIMTQMRILEMGRIADSLDVAAFLKCISNAETMGPILDPAMYMKAQNNLNAVKRLAELALEIKIAYGETYKAILETAIIGDARS